MNWEKVFELVIYIVILYGLTWWLGDIVLVVAMAILATDLDELWSKSVN